MGFVGGGICGSFIVFGVLSVLLYRPWRRRVDLKREALRRDLEDEDGVVLETVDLPIQEHGVPEIVLEDADREEEAAIKPTKTSAPVTAAGPSGRS